MFCYFRGKYAFLELKIYKSSRKLRKIMVKCLSGGKYINCDIEMVEGSEEQKEVLLLFIDRVSKEGKTIFGRKKLMKLIFLMEHLKNDGKLSSKNLLNKFDFIVYSLGPFSFGVMDGVEELKEKGLVEEKGGFIKKFVLTEKGKMKVKETRSPDSLETRFLVIKDFIDERGSELENLSLKLLGITRKNKGTFYGLSVRQIIREN